MGEDTLEPLVSVQRRWVLVTLPRPPARTARAATPERPPMQQTIPSSATTQGTMYQPMSVAHDHSASPVAGSKPSTLPAMASTSSVLPPATGTSTGVFHDSRMPRARHLSLPVFLSSAMRDSLSTLALTMTRSPARMGEAAVPQSLSPAPTSACQSALPSKSNANTPDLPKKTYRRSPSVAGV